MITEINTFKLHPLDSSMTDILLFVVNLDGFSRAKCGEFIRKQGSKHLTKDAQVVSLQKETFLRVLTYNNGIRYSEGSLSLERLAARAISTVTGINW